MTFPGSLCASCARARTITNDRGSVFTLCRMAKEDPRFARYPRQPVVRCTAYDPVRSDADPDPDTPEPDDTSGLG